MKERYWSVGNLVAVVCFVSVALLPWVFLWWRGESLTAWDLAAAFAAWLLIGTFAAANTASWRKRS